MPATCDKSRIHTREKAYACDYCHKRCTTKSNLNQHLGTHFKWIFTKETYKNETLCLRLAIRAEYILERKLMLVTIVIRDVPHNLIWPSIKGLTLNEYSPKVLSYACDYCHKRCTTKSNLTQHLGTHFKWIFIKGYILERNLMQEMYHKI